MQKVSVVVIAKNEEANIAKCLSSVSGFDEIILVDDYSDDKTVSIARRFGARVFKHRFSDFGSQRNFSISKARNEWVFVIDADETAEPALIEEIKKTLSKETDFAAFLVPFKTIFFGKLVRFGGQSFFQPRLFRKNKTRFVGLVHPRTKVEGSIGKLSNHILHDPFKSIFDPFVRARRGATLKSQELFASGKRFNSIIMVFFPPIFFAFKFFFQLGFLDGIRGLIFALAGYLYFFLIELRLWELGIKEKKS